MPAGKLYAVYGGVVRARSAGLLRKHWHTGRAGQTGCECAIVQRDLRAGGLATLIRVDGLGRRGRAFSRSTKEPKGAYPGIGLGPLEIRTAGLDSSGWAV